ESIKRALVHGARSAAIDLYFRIGHRPFKNDIDYFVFPVRWYSECMFVQTFFLTTHTVFRKAIIIFAKSLQFPAGRNRNSCPFAGVSSRCAIELPVYRIITAGAGEIMAYRFLSLDSGEECY